MCITNPGKTVTVAENMGASHNNLEHLGATRIKSHNEDRREKNMEKPKDNETHSRE